MNESSPFSRINYTEGYIHIRLVAKKFSNFKVNSMTVKFGTAALVSVFNFLSVRTLYLLVHT